MLIIRTSFDALGEINRPRMSRWVVIPTPFFSSHQSIFGSQPSACSLPCTRLSISSDGIPSVATSGGTFLDEYVTRVRLPQHRRATHPLPSLHYMVAGSTNMVCHARSEDDESVPAGGPLATSGILGNPYTGLHQHHEVGQTRSDRSQL